MYYIFRPITCWNYCWTNSWVALRRIYLLRSHRQLVKKI